MQRFPARIPHRKRFTHSTGRKLKPFIHSNTTGYTQSLMTRLDSIYALIAVCIRQKRTLHGYHHESVNVCDSKYNADPPAYEIPLVLSRRLVDDVAAQGGGSVEIPGGMYRVSYPSSK